ncbi:unnamed protein product, partial [Scytosiphon promiscuus]
RARQPQSKRPATSTQERRGSSILSKSDRVADVDVEPIQNHLSVRRRTAIGYHTTTSNGFDEGLARGRGAQAVCGQPLVPHPSSPRVQGECHPWHLSLDRFIRAEKTTARSEPWRIVAAPVTTGTDHEADALVTNLGPPPQAQRSARTPPQSSRSPSTERSGRRSSPTSALGPGGNGVQPGAEKVVVVTPRESSMGRRPRRDQNEEDEERQTTLLRRRRVGSLMEEPYDAGRDTHLAGSEDRGEHASEDNGRSTAPTTVGMNTNVMQTSDSPSRGKRGNSIITGSGDDLGISSGDQPGGSIGQCPDESDTPPASKEPEARTDDVGSPAANTGPRKRPMLGQAGAGAICVAESVMMGAGRTGLKQVWAKPKRRKKAETRPAPKTGENERNKNSKEEGRSSAASLRKVSKKRPDKPPETPRTKAQNMTIVDVALAAAERNREDRLKARAMLKNARLLISKGRINRAHTVLCEAIVFGGAPNLLVVLHELRARVRTCLDLWADAREDVQVALKGLEQGEGDQAHEMDSEEERMEEANLSGKKRWRAIVNRVILRRRYAQASLSTIVSTFLAARRGLRARVMLVNAKCLAQENDVEEALVCTREIRALAGRRSALPGGPSGVTSAVTHEAFKLEIQCLQESGQFAAAVVAAREMDAQVNRDINERRIQDEGSEKATRAGRTKGNGLDSVLFADEETWNKGGEASYEASVWAKVAIADMTTRSLAHRKDSGGKVKASGGGKGRFSSPKSKNNNRRKRKQRGEVIRKYDDLEETAAAYRYVPLRTFFPPGAKMCLQTGPEPKKSVADATVDAPVPVTAAGDTDQGQRSPYPARERRVQSIDRAELSSPTSKGGEGSRGSAVAGTARHGHGGGGEARNAHPDVNKEQQQRGDGTQESSPETKRTTTRPTVETAVKTSGSITVRPSVGNGLTDGELNVTDTLRVDATEDVNDLVERKERTSSGRGALVVDGADGSAGGVEAHDFSEEQGKGGGETHGSQQQVARKEDKQDAQDEEEDEPEESTKTDEEHRRELEAAIDPLKVLLGDERMAWRADIRTLRVLATGLERLADFSHGDAKNAADTTSDDGAVEEHTEGEPSRTRQEMLETGGESLRGVFAALEGKLSSLVATCTSLWRAHCRTKNIPIRSEKRTRKGGYGWGKLKTRARKGAGGDAEGGLPKMVRELLMSMLKNGISIEEYANHSGPDLQVGRIGGNHTSPTERPRPGSSHGESMVPNTKHNKRERLPKELEEQIAHMLKVLKMIPVVLESRARLATLAGEEPDATIMPLLESTIAYLCLPRINPPGGPSAIGMKIFGGDASPPKRRKAKKVASLRAASAAVLAAARGEKSTGNAAAKARGDHAPRHSPMAGHDGNAKTVSPSLGRQRPPPSSDGGGGGRQHDVPEQAATMCAASKAAAASGTATAKAASLLLPWDAESLASLFSALRDVAAALLLSERILKRKVFAIEAEDQADLEPRACTSDTTCAKGRVASETGRMEIGFDGHHPHSLLLHQCAELLKRAEDCLTVALAAAGCEGEVGVPLANHDAIPGGTHARVAGSGNESPSGVVQAASTHNSEEGRPTRFSSTSRVSTPPDATTVDDRPLDGGSGTPLPSVPTRVPAPQGMASEEDTTQDGTFFTDDTSHVPSAGRKDDGSELLAPPAVGEGERQREEDRGSAAGDLPSAALAAADLQAVSQLYGMRCTAREGLGLVRDAFSDCLGALAAAPTASKLWAKAASLALQVGSEIDRRWETNGAEDCTGKSRKDVSLEWANEAMRLASGLLRLCPRSHHGFLFRGQAAERAGQHERAKRDYCCAQHINPSSPLPLLLRARLSARLGHLESERPGGGAGEDHAAEAFGMIRAFLWSPCLPVDAISSGSSISPRETSSGTERTWTKGLATTWWRGRIEEHQRNYGAASEYYEQVYEKDPTIGHLNRLASALLGATQPGRAYQVLSKFLDGGTSCVGAPVADGSKEVTTEVEPESALEPTSKSELPSPPGNAKGYQLAGYSTARLLRGRCLFVLGKDEQWTESFQAAYKGDLAQASVLYEWSLAEAISTCMRSAGSTPSELEGNTEGPSAGVDRAASSPALPFPTMTGIAAWDSALLQDHRHRESATSPRGRERSGSDRVAGPPEGPGIDYDVGVGADAASFNEKYSTQDDKAIVESLTDTASSSDSSWASDDDLASSFDEKMPQDADDGNGASRHGEDRPCLQTLPVDDDRRQPDNELDDGDGDISLPRGSDDYRHTPADDPRPLGTLEERESFREDAAMRTITGASTRSRPRRRMRKQKPRGLDRALDLITRCIRKDRFNSKAYNLRAELQLHLGRRDRAIGDYRAAASLEAGNSRSRMNMGVVHLNASRSGLAFAEFNDIERASKGSGERALAAFNLGVAAATAGDLSSAEEAFTRALDLLATGGPSRHAAKLVTPAACLANRGLVRFVMKRFRDAEADLKGAPTDATHRMARTRPAPCEGGAFRAGKIATQAVASMVASGTTAFAGGALDTLDCELGRALAEGRLEDRASRETAGNRMRKLLRSTRLLACEMASIRIGLGNLEATRGGASNSGNDRTPSAAGTDVSSKEKARPVHTRTSPPYVNQATTAAPLIVHLAPGSLAVRQFLHAIHACPTASAAWLNASEALETSIHDGDASERDKASSVSRRDGCYDSVTNTRVGSPTETVLPSLALINAVLAMAPTHHAAMRCRATILARVGRTLEALSAADRSVSAAENAVRAAKRKDTDVSSDGMSASRIRRPPARPVPSGGRHLGQQSSTPAKPVVDAFEAITDANGAITVITSAGRSFDGLGGAGHGGSRGGPGGGENQFAPQGSIGFMRSSKATVVVGGGLLLTGGGRVTAFDVAKSLVLRGCLRQKMGRRDQAEQDYRRALEVCHDRLSEIEENGVDAGVSSNGLHTNEVGGVNVESSRQRFTVDPLRERTGDRNDDDGDSVSIRRDVTAKRESSSAARGGQRSESKPGREEGLREVLKLKSLIHHNLASLHIAAVLGTDIRVSLRKAAIAREASEIVATDNKVIAALRPASFQRRAQCRHEGWWSSTVLAVASMVSETGWAVPWRGSVATHGNNDNAAGQAARFQLGSAEIVAAIPSGYDAADDKVCAPPTQFSLTGTARSRALLAVRVNLAAAEKVGALSGAGSAPPRPINQLHRREALAKAIASLSSAIALSPNPDPKLYVERGGLFAMMDASGTGKDDGGGDGEGVDRRGPCADEYAKAAASDFATALWLDSQLQGR